MKKINWILLCIILCCACRNGNKTKVLQNHQEAILIDRVWDENADMVQMDTLSFTITEDQQAIANHFGATKLVPLETSSQSLIGKIEKIICYNNKIYIHNDAGDNSSIMVFDNLGRFEAKIDKTGRGPGEYIKLGDFDVDTEGNIYISDLMQLNRLLVYNSNLQYNKTINLESSLLTFGIFNGKIWVYTGRSIFQNDHKYTLLVMDENGKVCHNFFPFEHNMDGNLNSHKNIFTKNNGKLYINIPFTNIIYSADSLNNIRAEYYLEYQIKKSTGEHANSFEEDAFKFFYSMGDKVIAQTSQTAFFLGYYNKSAKRIDFANMWYLKDNFAKNILTTPLANPVKGIVNDSVILHPMEAFPCLEIYKRDKERYKHLSQEHKEIINNLDEDDNPVLFFNSIR